MGEAPERRAGDDVRGRPGEPGPGRDDPGPGDPGRGDPGDDARHAEDVRALYAKALATRERSALLAGRLQATQRRASVNWQLVRDAWGRAERIRAKRLVAGGDPGWLRYSAYARLHARLTSLPVIEQAKGILMAQYGWPEEQAFDALRQVSQQRNIKVRELAASIVARAERPASAQAGSDATHRQASAQRQAGSDARHRTPAARRQARPGPGHRGGRPG